MPRRTDTLLAGHYFLAVHGLALLRTLFEGTDAAPPYADAICTIAGELDEFPHSLAIPLLEHDVEEGYTQWAPRYDKSEPSDRRGGARRARHARRPARGRRARRGCGTGRHAAELAPLGHR